MSNHMSKKVAYIGYHPKKGDIVRITRLHKSDAFSKSATKTVGLEWEIVEALITRPNGSCAFTARKVVKEPSDPLDDFCFYAAYVELVKAA